MKDKLMKKRIGMAFFGVILSGISVGFFRQAAFGTDPFQVMVNGIANKITFIDFGTLYMILNLIMLIAIFFLDKHYINISTFINIFLLGYVVEFSDNTLQKFVGDAPSMAIRIGCMLIAILLLCFASSFYFTADLGVSTYDAVALIMTDRKLGQFRFIRIGTDLFCVIVGFLLGAIVGAGTLITAFFMGPLIEVFKEHVAIPFLYGKNPAKTL